MDDYPIMLRCMMFIVEHCITLTYHNNSQNDFRTDQMADWQIRTGQLEIRGTKAIEPKQRRRFIFVSVCVCQRHAWNCLYRN